MITAISGRGKWIFTLVVLSLYFNEGYSQVETGKPAPEIHVDEWVDNPWIQQVAGQDVEGKAIVLDFWFTHCAPCVYTIPHLNELAENYSNEDVVFISITFENREEVAKFLPHKRMLAHIGTDTAYTTINAFEVNGYPQTFLIDKERILRWSGHPSHLTEDQIDLLIDKKYYSKVESAVKEEADFTDDEIDDLVLPANISVNEYMDGASGRQSNSSEFSVVNYSLKDVFSILLEKSENRISTPDNNRYDIRIKIPKGIGNKDIQTVLTNSILSELSAELVNKEELVEGYHLMIENDSLFVKNAINPEVNYYGMGTSVGQGFWSAKGAQIADLIRELESRFEIYIEDESKVFGFFELRFPISSFEDAEMYLMEFYGIEFKKGKVKTDISIIRQAD